MRSFPKISRLGLLEVCHQTFDDDIKLQMTSSVYDLDNIWASDKKCLRVLPLTPHYSDVTPIGFQSVHFPSNVRPTLTVHLQEERHFLAQMGKKATEIGKPDLISNAFREKS